MRYFTVFSHVHIKFTLDKVHALLGIKKNKNYSRETRKKIKKQTK